jgi:hypothetical protein
MARVSKLPKALTGAFFALLLGSLVLVCGVSPAASLGLPELSVEVPVVSVKTPAVTVTTPPAPPAKTPTASNKPPTTPTKTTPTKTSATKAPSVDVNAPSVSGQSPTVSAPTTSTPSLGKTEVPRVVATSTSSTPGTGNPAGSGSAPASAGASTANDASRSAPSGQAAPLDGAAGYGAGPGVQAPTDQTGTRGSSGEHARIANERSLVETVARLQACLSELPQANRRALMLRTGVGSSQALSASATAARLHLDAARFARVERQALGELRKAARTRACGQMGELVTAVVAFVAGPGVGRGGSAGTGGVKAARYAFSPPSRHAIEPAESSRGSLLGDVSPTASSAIVILLLLAAAAIVASIVVTHGSGNSPPWRRWRRRVSHSLRRLR